MTYYPIPLILLLAVLNWISVEKKWRTLEYVTKPGFMLALLWWMHTSVGLGGGMLWFTLGVVFCLAGDVFLMLPRDMFIFGLVSFLVGQIFYVVAYNNQPPYINLWGGAVLLLLATYMGWLYPRLSRSLVEKGRKKLSIPVLIYSVVISLMVYSALMTWSRPIWPTIAALSASIGAMLFYTSDSILAWDRFIRPISKGRLKNISTYHLGQVGIILSAILMLTQA